MSSGHCQQDNVEELFSIFIGHCWPTVIKRLKAKKCCKILGHSCPIFLKRSFVLMPADLCTLNAINDSPGGSTLWTLISFISCWLKPAKNAVLHITRKFFVQNNFLFWWTYAASLHLGIDIDALQCIPICSQSSINWQICQFHLRFVQIDMKLDCKSILDISKNRNNLKCSLGSIKTATLINLNRI